MPDAIPFRRGTEILPQRKQGAMRIPSRLNYSRHRGGFTLIELLVVLILIGVSSSYLMLNTNLLRIFDAPNEAPEQILRLIEAKDTRPDYDTFSDLFPDLSDEGKKKKKMFFYLGQHMNGMQQITKPQMMLNQNYCKNSIT